MGRAQIDNFSEDWPKVYCALQDLEVAMSLPEVTTRDRELRRSLQFTLRLEAILHLTIQMVSSISLARNTSGLPDIIADMVMKKY